MPRCAQDFLIMFLHHLATISLITFSYVNNMARVGTLVMCLHDAADVLIEVRLCETLPTGGGSRVGKMGVREVESEKRYEREENVPPSKVTIPISADINRYR